MIGHEYYGCFNNITDFTNKFNADQQNKLFVFLDEVGDTSKGCAEAHNIIKSKTTERTIRIEVKGSEAYSVNNYARYMSASNYENNMRIEADDRRFICLHLNPKRKGDYDYFKLVFDEINNMESCISAFSYFGTRDISKWNPKRIPNTKLKQTQKLHALPVVSFLINLFNKNIELDEPHKSRFDESEDDKYKEIIISAVDLYQIYSIECKKNNEPTRPKKYFMKDLENMKIERSKAVCFKNEQGQKVSIKGFKWSSSYIQQCIATATGTPEFKIYED